MATPESSRPPPPLPDHLLELILDRLPPEDPSSLLRASLVCKHWRDLIYDPKFLPNLLELGRAPQMLGFLYHSESQGRREVAHYDDLSPKCASTYYQYGRALLKKAQKAANHFSIVPKSPPYEKTVEGTSSGPDTTSSENSDSEEGQNSNGEYEEDRNGDTDKDGNEIACNDIDSDLDRASKMLEVARRIVEESEVNTVETFRILSALTEVFMEKRKR